MDARRRRDLEENPFSALFPSVQAAEEYRKLLQNDIRAAPSNDEPMSRDESETDSAVTQVSNQKELSSKQKDEMAERIFLITSTMSGRESEDVPRCSVFIESDEDGPLHSIIEQLLFSRLLLKQPRTFLKTNSTMPDDNGVAEQQAKEGRPVVYLLQCFNRLLHEKENALPHHMEIISTYRSLIIMNISTAFISPEIFAELSKSRSDVHQQFYGILAENDCLDTASPPRICFYEVLDYTVSTEPTLLSTAFEPLLTILAKELKEGNLMESNLGFTMCIFETFAAHPGSALPCVEYSLPNAIVPFHGQQTNSTTLFEILLGKSCLVRDPQTRMLPFFEEAQRMRSADVESEEYQLHLKTERFHTQLYKIAHLLLKHRTSRVKFLTWIGQFLARHEYLAKMWTQEQMDVFMDIFGTDAALVNLSSVLLRLSLPFCVDKVAKSKPETPKFLKIDATYTSATGEPNPETKGVHGSNLHKDTCLQSVKEGSLPLQSSDSYNFISECFFMTHRAIYLGVHGLIKKFYRLNRNLNREGDLYRQIRESGSTNDMAEVVTKRFESGMRTYLSIKGFLTEPTFLDACIRLYGTTAQYLNHIAMTNDMSALAAVTLPLPKSDPSHYLYYVPEYVMENMTDIILLIWRFARPSIYLVDPYIHDLLLNISIYMGNKTCMSNPHLRASLAEVLEILLPLPGRTDGLLGDREEIFMKFPYKGFLAVATLQLFVDIEFTGDPHQFEQKFHYRQPLYKILRYLWGKKASHEAAIKEVCRSIDNIDDPSHPLFLQFTNLLLNDLIYLLDEAMGFLAQIKTLENERDTGEWDELNQREKMAKEAELKQIGTMAKYHNILSNDTVDTLVYLTAAPAVKDLFSNPSLADRVAVMLDDFLLKLVGPKMSVLRVKDLSAYEFKPKVLVLELCKIYMNLCDRDEFCRAISRDGRSYSSKLFPMACQVLRRIGNEDVRDGMWKISEKIKRISDQDEEDEEMFIDAPDEFYDALMHTLMRDPVILPTSRQVVDRSTISRHLMSDPTDPFNRNPLTMLDIIPDTELKSRISQWIEEKRKKRINTE